MGLEKSFKNWVNLEKKTLKIEIVKRNKKQMLVMHNKSIIHVNHSISPLNINIYITETTVKCDCELVSCEVQFCSLY